ncbi:hypothetical protein [Burkholderia cepacia]|uniref:hypothetical protein n=1 Tax=Burkholderia cepacia TaxID=292 RepID=UPI0015753378|nr:hypothetical protein [Burkholderia cepacia]NTX25086.1 hypothetical protein [Burkholderia cepacia]
MTVSATIEPECTALRRRPGFARMTFNAAVRISGIAPSTPPSTNSNGLPFHWDEVCQFRATGAPLGLIRIQRGKTSIRIEGTPDSAVLRAVLDRILR